MAVRNIVVLPYDEKWKQAFEDIKVELEAAKLYPHDIDAYIKHKSKVIEKIYKELGLI